MHDRSSEEMWAGRASGCLRARFPAEPPHAMSRRAAWVLYRPKPMLRLPAALVWATLLTLGVIGAAEAEGSELAPKTKRVAPHTKSKKKKAPHRAVKADTNPADAKLGPAPHPEPPRPEPPQPEPEVHGTTTAAPPTAAITMLHAPDHDHVEGAPPPPPRRFTISLNPLPIIAGRYGLNGEVSVVPHHAVTASAWLQTFTPAMLRVIMPREIDVHRGADARFGGELGYRFYSRAADGFFAGLSGVVMPIMYPRVTPSYSTEVVSFLAYGAALDVGVQAMTSSGFTISGGLGAMYLAYTPPASVAPPAGVAVPTFPEVHVLPRLLLAAGWSF